MAQIGDDSPPPGGDLTATAQPLEEKDELYEALQIVEDEESFRRFLLALRDDRKRAIERERCEPSDPHGPDAGGWENVTIEAFFDAAAAWAKDSANGTTSYAKPTSPWRRCADILYMGKIYE